MAASTEENAVTELRTVKATAKFVRVSARKARLVADNIRGRTVPEARTILAFTERAAAVDVEKVLRSAVANAESNPALRRRPVVARDFVDEGPTLKRFRARARGRRPASSSARATSQSRVERGGGGERVEGAPPGREQPCIRSPKKEAR